MSLSQEIIDEIVQYGLSQQPREACGLIVDESRFIPCRNLAHKIEGFSGSEYFILDPRDWVRAQKQGTITSIVHTHPSDHPDPSEWDQLSCNSSGLPWVVVAVPSGQVSYLAPQVEKSPLLGRPYFPGVHDCLSLARDYYEEKYGISLPSFHYDPDWWKKGHNYILDHYAEWGFVDIHRRLLREGDAIVIQGNGSRVPNHILIYLGDNEVLHQPVLQLSMRQPYGADLQHRSVLFLRHETLL